MNTITTGIKATVTVLPTDKIEIRQGCEYAAWYTLWRVLPGTYEVKQVMEDCLYPNGRHAYVAEADAEVVQDYYASHFGGVPVGKPYDIKQNAGKRGKVVLWFTPQQMLKHEAVTVDEACYEELLLDAMKTLRARCETSFRCIRDNMGAELGGRDDKLEWAVGHAESFVECSRLYREFDMMVGRREVNRKYLAEGYTRTVNTDIWAKRDNREFVGRA